MKPRPPSISLSLDDLLTEEGLELTLTATDDQGTRKETTVIPWSDLDPPKEPEN